MQSTGSAASLAHRPRPSSKRNGQRGVVACGASAGGESAALHGYSRGNQVAVSLSLPAVGQNWDRLEPVLRARMLAGAATFFTVEAGTFEDYLPDEAIRPFRRRVAFRG
jgi:hypothetical protein